MAHQAKFYIRISFNLKTKSNKSRKHKIKEHPHLRGKRTRSFSFIEYRSSKNNSMPKKSWIDCSWRESNSSKISWRYSLPRIYSLLLFPHWKPSIIRTSQSHYLIIYQSIQAIKVEVEIRQIRVQNHLLSIIILSPNILKNLKERDVQTQLKHHFDWVDNISQKHNLRRWSIRSWIVTWDHFPLLFKIVAANREVQAVEEQIIN